MEKKISIAYNGSTKKIPTPLNYDELISQGITLFDIPSSIDIEAFAKSEAISESTVSNQTNYERALNDGFSKFIFRISKTNTQSDRSKNIIEEEKKLEPKINFEKVQSSYVKNVEAKPLTYSCFHCNGMDKHCTSCNGTGKIKYLHKIESIIRKKIKEAIDSEFTKITNELAKNPLNDIVANRSSSEANAKLQVNLDKTETKPIASIIEEIPMNRNVMKAGSSFCKEIIVKNTGNKPWPSDTRLAKIKGDDIQTTVSPVGDILPGKTVKIKLNVNVPSNYGHYFSLYSLVYENGKEFGDRTWIDFLVKERKK